MAIGCAPLIFEVQSTLMSGYYFQLGQGLGGKNVGCIIENKLDVAGRAGVMMSCTIYDKQLERMDF